MRCYKLIFLIILCSSLLQADIENLLNCAVDFHQSMQVGYIYDKIFAKNDKNWRIAEMLYNKHFIEYLDYANTPRIPLIVHHIWLGSELPDYARSFRETWIEHNPHWTFILWTDHPSSEYGYIFRGGFEDLKKYLMQPNRERFIVVDMRHVVLKNQVAFKKQARNYGEKSDIARYEIINAFGGLYVDTDFECIRPFDDLHHICNFYTGIAHDKEFCLYNGLIASKANSPILKEAIAGLTHRKNSGNSLAYSGPYYFTQCFNAKVAVEGKAIAFPITFLYPWPYYERDHSYQEARKWIKSETFAMHYWKVSWMKK